MIVLYSDFTFHDDVKVCDESDIQKLIKTLTVHILGVCHP